MPADESDAAPVRRLEAAVARLAQLVAGRTKTGITHVDADEVHGTVATDDAIGFDPIPLLGALDECGARVVVIGQVAGIMHGSSELTGDLDLLWDGSPEQAPHVAAGFARLEASLTDQDGVPLRDDASAFSLPKVLFRTTVASGDCCTPNLPWGDLPVADFLERSRKARTVQGHIIRYLDLGDLIWMRRASGRPKDIRRATELA